MKPRIQKHGVKQNAYEYGLAKALVAIAEEWVKPTDAVMRELKQLLKKIKNVRSGLTQKNRDLLKRLEDPIALAALIDLPARLLAEAERQPVSAVLWRKHKPASRSVSGCSSAYGQLTSPPWRLTRPCSWPTEMTRRA